MTFENDAQLQALKEFASAENKQLVDRLEEILDDVAKTGQYIFPWHFMKPLYAHKLDKVTSEFLNTNPPLNPDGSPNDDEINKLKDFREELLQSFDKFVCAPFTLQRVTELLTNPKRHYKTTPKFFRGLEKNIMVVSTMEMVTPEQRTILKRQHDDSCSQNGTTDNDLKPPVQKKSATEDSNQTNNNLNSQTGVVVDIPTTGSQEEEKEEAIVDVVNATTSNVIMETEEAQNNETKEESNEQSTKTMENETNGVEEAAVEEETKSEDDLKSNESMDES